MPTIAVSVSFSFCISQRGFQFGYPRAQLTVLAKRIIQCVMERPRDAVRHGHTHTIASTNASHAATHHKAAVPSVMAPPRRLSRPRA
jgi:hypothetical protein